MWGVLAAHTTTPLVRGGGVRATSVRAATCARLEASALNLFRATIPRSAGDNTQERTSGIGRRGTRSAASAPVNRRAGRRVCYTAAAGGEWSEQTLKQACSQGDPEAPCAFKGLMIHGILQFALRIAFRCVLHRCESQDIRC